MSECYCVIEILVEKADRDLLEGPEDPTSYNVFIDFNISVIKWLRQQYYLPLWSNNFVWRLHTLALNPRGKRVSLKTTSKKHDLQIQVKNHLAFTIHFHIIFPQHYFWKEKYCHEEEITEVACRTCAMYASRTSMFHSTVLDPKWKAKNWPQ